MIQRHLFDFTVNGPQASSVALAEPRFAGDDYVHDRDCQRLTGQIQRVYGLMQDGQWRTLAEIAEATGDPPASISAQLRHLRKKRFGAHDVRREHVGGGLYRYRVVVGN